MAFEKYWAQVPAVPFTANGKDNGEITVDGACRFKVGQIVVISSTSQSDLRVKIKRIPSYNIIIVGPSEGKDKGNIRARIDVSNYLLTDIATIRAEEQNRPSIPKKDMDQATFEEEPTLAWRSHLVDKCGESYTDTNRFPVDANFSANIDLKNPNAEGLFVKNIPTKGTEASFTFPNKTAFYQIRVRNNKDVLKIGLNTGDITNGDYWTLDFGNTYSPEVQNDFPDSYTLYFESKHKNDVDVEIRYWYFI